MIPVPPVSVLIKPSSSACNMACKYCFYRDEAQNRSESFMGFMTPETAEMTVKRAFEFAEGSCSFMFQGGEPTLSGLEFFKSFIELEKKHNTKNIKVFNSIQTNGFAVTEEWAGFFSENHFLVGLSLDGTAELHNLNRTDSSGSGTFNRVMKTAALFDRFGVEYNILTVLTGKNARSIEKIYNFCKKNNFNYLQFIPCLDAFGADGKSSYSLTNDEYKSFLITLFGQWLADLKSGRYISIRNIDNIMQIMLGGRPEICSLRGCCSVQFAVEGDGSVYPCDFYVLDEYKIGDVYNNSFKEMVSSENCRSFLEGSFAVPHKCKECECFAICRNGCRRERMPDQSGESINRFCEATKGFYKECRASLFEAARILAQRR